MKGRVWLEAYEGHIKTGQPMTYFLREMNPQTRSEENQGAAVSVLFVSELSGRLLYFDMSDNASYS